MTTEIKISHEGGNHPVSVSICNRNEDGSPGEVSETVVLDDRGCATYHHVYDTQCIVVTELEDQPVDDSAEPAEHKSEEQESGEG